MATKGTVSGVIANMVTLVVDGPVAQNEICYISTGGDRLMAEVIKVVGTQVYVQVFESTRGLKVGAEAEFTVKTADIIITALNNLRHFIASGQRFTALGAELRRLCLILRGAAAGYAAHRFRSRPRASAVLAEFF